MRSTRWTVGVFVACLAGFVGLVCAVYLLDSKAWEQSLLLWFRESTEGYPMRGPGWLPGFVRDLTSLGGVELVVFIALFVLVYLLLRGAWRAAAVMVIGLAGTQLTVTTLKLLFSRARPDFLDPGAVVSTHSFPSGHAAIAAVTAVMLAWAGAHRHDRRRLKVFFWVAGALAVALIGFSRVYLGVHYLTDVLAGWLVGLVWAAIAIRVGYALACCGPAADRSTAEAPDRADRITREPGAADLPRQRGSPTVQSRA